MDYFLEDDEIKPLPMFVRNATLPCLNAFRGPSLQSVRSLLQSYTTKLNRCSMATFPPPPSFANCIGNAGYTPSHATSIFATYPTLDPRTTRPRELATDSRGAGPGGSLDNTSPARLQSRRSSIKWEEPLSARHRAARVRLTTGQARTRVLGMTFRPGPSPLGGPRPNSTKDGGERGQPPEKILARTRGKGTTPGFEGQAGSYIMAQKRTVGGSHFGAVTSGQSPHCQSASATRFQPLPLSGRRSSPRRHNVSVTEVCSILPCHPPPPPPLSDRPTMHCQY